MKLYELIGEGLTAFTVKEDQRIYQVVSVNTTEEETFLLNREVEPYFNEQELEIQRLLAIIEKRDKELAKHKQPRTYTKLDISHRNDVLDFKHHNPRANGQTIAKACDVNSSFVSKVLSGTHSLCSQAPRWEAPHAEAEIN